MSRSPHLVSVCAIALMLFGVLTVDGALAQGAAPAITSIRTNEKDRIVLTWTLPAGHYFREIKWNRTGNISPTSALDAEYYNGGGPSDRRTTATLDMVTPPGDYYFRVVTASIDTRIATRAPCPTGIGENAARGGPCYSEIAHIKVLLRPTPPAAVTEPAPPSAAAAPPPVAAAPSASGSVPAPASAASQPPPVRVDPPVQLPPPAPVIGIPPTDRTTLPTLTVEGCRAVTAQDPRLFEACGAFLKAESAKVQGAAAPPVALEQQPLRGTIEKGKLRLIEPTGRSTESTTAGTEVMPGSTIVTDAGGATMTLDGGSRLKVGPNSRVVLGSSPEAAVEQKVGRTFYDIKSRRFNVHVVTPKGRYFIAVKGTQFTVDVAEDGSGTVQVWEGAVEVTSEGQTVEVTAGSSVAVRAGEAPASPTSVRGGRVGAIVVVAMNNGGWVGNWNLYGLTGLAVLLMGGGALAFVRRHRVPS